MDFRSKCEEEKGIDSPGVGASGEGSELIGLATDGDETHFHPVGMLFSATSTAFIQQPHETFSVLLDSGASVSLTPERELFGDTLQPTKHEAVVANGKRVPFAGVGAAFGLPRCIG